ncbi:hypothetical protein D7D52_34065 [Nocardia yunnanensis]|uniref:Uncharacterized protein n=1 Tax=Nocardia yunnanensis TaxID=2382165 RepID=A0A386ZL53_9NOCA|nr:hypothetical protein [Nocardia yunnanensis]AYF78013.1 hypothetical protein D7D52_34065 [Nocardia yunnanensis]
MNDYVLMETADRRAVAMPPGALAVLLLLAFVFAAGLYLGVLLFGTRESLPTTVVTCPAPGTAQVAVWPQGCPRDAVVTR